VEAGQGHVERGRRLSIAARAFWFRYAILLQPARAGGFAYRLPDDHRIHASPVLQSRGQTGVVRSRCGERPSLAELREYLM